MGEEKSTYIQQVHLKGYKSVKDLTVSFQKGLNIIIGANGSGKTNFMEFLDAAYNKDYERLLNNRKFEVEILANSFELKIQNENNIKNNYKFKVIENVKESSESFTRSYFLNEDKRILNTEIVNSKGERDKMPFFDFYQHETLYLRFDNPLNQILKDKIVFSFMLFEGFDIINLGHVVSGHFVSKEKIENFLNRVFRVFKDIKKSKYTYKVIREKLVDSWIKIDGLKVNLKRFSPIKDIKIDWELTRQIVQNEDGVDIVTIEGIDFQFYVNNEWLNWTQLSDGTKRLFYLIGSVTYAKENEIILMEEPELGVHPHQLTLLMNFLKAESETKQIIISTHSPQVLNCLKEDELDHIIVARHEGKAGTQMYPLSDEEKGFAAEYMKNQAFLSDYWLQSGFMNDETIEQV
jgi:predicted ATP-dependent endonuclease of OLD family